MSQDLKVNYLIEALSYYIENNSGVVVGESDNKSVVCKINQDVSIVPLSEILENYNDFEPGQWIKLNIEYDE